MVIEKPHDMLETDIFFKNPHKKIGCPEGGGAF